MITKSATADLVREPGIQRLLIEIPGSRDARPGMTRKRNPP
jgi:hypothetical protein